jgi:hypothetical protein
MHRKYVIAAAVVVLAIFVGSVFTYISMSNPSAPTPTPTPSFSTSNIKPVNPHYLAFSYGNESKIFLISAEPKYDYWTQNDTHMDWFANGPVVHRGDPVFVVNLTIRNDYTQNDSAGAVSAVDSQNRSSVGFTVTLFDKNNNVIDALQAYPQTVTALNVSFFSFKSGEAESFELYFATGNREIDHYILFVAYVSSQPAP